MAEGPITRIPLNIVATATGQVTEGVLVGVMASALDALENGEGAVLLKLTDHYNALGALLAALEDGNEGLAYDCGPDVAEAYKDARDVRDRWIS